MRYYIIAGEASGDLHGSNLIRGLLASDPDSLFRFWGGDMMLSACEGKGTLVHHYRNGAVMGFSEILSKGSALLKNLSFCRKDILEWHPDAVILIDYPGFNMKIAKFAHGAGLKVLYYIAPKTWASRERRNRDLKRYVDRLFIIFPFEVPYFEKRGVPFVYMGNPLVDAVDSHHYSRPVEGRYVAVLPGSRKGEIERMMPVCMEVVRRLGCRAVIAGAPSRSREDYEPFIRDVPNVELVFDRTYDILKYADAAIVNSGTASLEAALIGTPQVVGWSTSRLTYFIAERLLGVRRRISFITLGNLILGREAYREFVQGDFTPDNLYPELKEILFDAARRERMVSEYSAIRAALGGRGASKAVAEAMIGTLRQI